MLKLFLESGESIDTSVLTTDEDISTDELKVYANTSCNVYIMLHYLLTQERVKEQHDLYKQKGNFPFSLFVNYLFLHNYYYCYGLEMTIAMM